MVKAVAFIRSMFTECWEVPIGVVVLMGACTGTVCAILLASALGGLR